jgi:adenylosuccinate synthase
MFRNLLRSSAATNAFLATGAAAVTGSAWLVGQPTQPEATTTACADHTVVGMLQGLYSKVSNIEAVLGSIDKKVPRSKKPGIDVVLGAQWGDEGKGKLVDILSQVRLSEEETERHIQIFILTIHPREDR